MHICSPWRTDLPDTALQPANGAVVFVIAWSAMMVPLGLPVYGQAGAIDFYGPRHGLPRARAPIGSYWFWGPGEKPGRIILRVGGEGEELEGFCGELVLVARIDEPWVVPEEQNLGIWICHEPRRTLQEIWPAYRGRN